MLDFMNALVVLFKAGYGWPRLVRPFLLEIVEDRGQAGGILKNSTIYLSAWKLLVHVHPRLFDIRG